MLLTYLAIYFITNIIITLGIIGINVILFGVAVFKIPSFYTLLLTDLTLGLPRTIFAYWMNTIGTVLQVLGEINDKK